MPTFLSLFAGIGGFDLGLERAGFRCVAQCELDPFCTRVLERRWPHIARWPDVREWQGNGDEHSSRGSRAGRPELPGEHGLFAGWPPERECDLLTGGFPCQDLSVAGKRAGLQGERSGLFWEIIRVQKIVQATWGLFENVPGLLSSNRGRDMWTVLQGLRECWPAVGWRILDSQHFGVAQRRRRVFFVCGPTEACVASVLFESESGTGDSAKGGEAGAGVAGSLTSGSHGVGVNEPGRRAEDDINLVMQPLMGHHCRNVPDSDNLIVAPLTSTYAKGADRGGNDRGSLPRGHLITHPLTSEGSDASEDGTGRGVPITISPWLMRNSQSPNEFGIREGGLPGAMDSTGAGGVADRLGVRRLTPVECERLQGFPDRWTCLCDEESCRCPDSPRYRSLGNAVTVNVAAWLGERLALWVDARGRRDGPA